MTVHVTLEEAQAELLELAAGGEVVTIEREGLEPVYVSLQPPKRRGAGEAARHRRSRIAAAIPMAFDHA